MPGSQRARSAIDHMTSDGRSGPTAYPPSLTLPYRLGLGTAVPEAPLAALADPGRILTLVDGPHTDDSGAPIESTAYKPLELAREVSPSSARSERPVIGGPVEDRKPPAYLGPGRHRAGPRRARRGGRSVRWRGPVGNSRAETPAKVPPTAPYVSNSSGGSSGTVDVLLDVIGWSATSGGSGTGFNPIAPTRIMDTRSGVQSGVCSPGGTCTTLTAGTTKRVQVVGRLGIPANGV